MIRNNFKSSMNLPGVVRYGGEGREDRNKENKRWNWEKDAEKCRMMGKLKDSSSCISSGTSKIQLWLWWFHMITDKLFTPGLSVHFTSVGIALLVLESDYLCCSLQTERAAHRHTNVVKCVYMVLALRIGIALFVNKQFASLQTS